MSSLSEALRELGAGHPELAPLLPAAHDAFELLASSFRAGGKVLVCGNGGSAADADHIAAELMKGMCGRRRLADRDAERFRALLPPPVADHLASHLEPALPTLSLSGPAALVSAVANDTDPNLVFAQQVYGYGRPGDVLWTISTSGRSRNCVLAAAVARAQGLRVLAMTGADPSELGQLADVCLAVPAVETARAQELHRPLYHAICAALEADLVPS